LSVIKVHGEQLTETEWSRGSNIKIAHLFKLSARIAAAGSQ